MKFILKIVMVMLILSASSMNISASSMNISAQSCLVNEFAIIKHIGSTFAVTVPDYVGEEWRISSTHGLKLISNEIKPCSMRSAHAFTRTYTYQASKRGYQYIDQTLYVDGKYTNTAVIKFLVI